MKITALTLLLVVANLPIHAISLPDRINAKPVFTAVDAETEYTAADLYEYINGGADVYIDAGMKTCTVRRYGVKGDKKRLFEVAAYEMERSLQAFGIFRQLHREIRTGIGAEYSAAPHLAAFWKSAHYTEVSDRSPKPAADSLLEKLAGFIAELTPGDLNMPADLALLPDSLRIAGSERYWKSGFLSRGFFNNVISASYTLDHGVCTLFVMPCATDSAAAAGLGAVTDAFMDSGGRVKAFASRKTVAGCVGCIAADSEARPFGMLIDRMRGR